ncbi:hypothetical protein [Acinetobacter sp. ANC 3813]|uniref:hypothetical protein n=1 Tax=Acinetobacter sp. ANC 3813 TaxID=1977873 RepID=UPI000A35852F|nr:hypothetical protein [Acinetobacter sp. ANC 3813]OTG90137.1 hypothetical protein B9T34_09185 [Acinetobacter sp. ANC 3813]
MNFIKDTVAISMLGAALLLSACDDSKKPQPSETEEKASVFSLDKESSDNEDLLPYLNTQEQLAKIAQPFCENKSCIDLDIQTIHTADAWLNTWIERNQALAVQDQIGQKQNLSLQQAINAYVKKSDAWQAELKSNQPYSLALYTRIPYQRNQYVLLQVGIDSAQENIKVKDRHYFFVADRRSQKGVSLLDIIEPKQQANMNNIVQDAYAKWLKEQDSAVQASAPKKLYWGQSDWFFDQEGVGLHYRPHEIVKDAKQLDIYLTKQQTQQVLKADAYQHMF